MDQSNREHFRDQSVVAEVRAIREAIDEEVGHDVERLAERVRKAGEAYRQAHGLSPAKLPDANPAPEGDAAVG